MKSNLACPVSTNKVGQWSVPPPLGGCPIRVWFCSRQRNSSFTLIQALNIAMCGIHVAITRDPGTGALPPSLHDCLCNRGPDHVAQVTARLKPRASREDAFLTFTSTVLSLRGDHVTEQPFQDPQTGSVLCWNGEAWRIGGRVVRGNDGEAVFALLRGASSSGTGSSDAVLGALRSVEGPFAFVYFDAPSQTLYFGRDRLGRRSLLICHDDTEESLVISSVAETCEERWKEVEADGVYSMALHHESFFSPYAPPLRHDWLPEHGTEFVSVPVVNS
jgi:asparagine synthetase B (glutamine-hydrolysing)